MKATIKIEKSFDETNEFSKEWENGDICEFMEAEGGYLDRLCQIAADKGKSGEGFTVTYTVTVTK